MKNSYFYCFFVAVCGTLAFTSCSSEVLEDTKITSDGGKQQITFSAKYENIHIASRTYLNENDLSVVWSEDDKLSIFDKNGNNGRFEISSGAGTTSAVFTGLAEESDKYYALYPYWVGAEIDGNKITSVYFNSEQIPTLNSFSPGANLMTAVSTDGNTFEFKNLCSIAKITTTTEYSKIILSGGVDDILAGQFDLTIADDGTATATPSGFSQYNSVTLKNSDNSTFGPGTYYISIMSGDLSMLSVKCIGPDDKKIEKSINKPVTVFTRGTIIDLGTANTENGWVDPDIICPDENHPHKIDLGAGVLWSCTNVGATSPIEFGNHYEWGEVEPHDENADYSWSKYIHANGAQNKIKKYNTKSSNGIVDNKTLLDPEDDAATANWGSEWRMPTYEEVIKLYEVCTWEWTTINGVPGKKMKSLITGKSIFLTAPGYRYETRGWVSPNVSGFYWTSTLYESNPIDAYYLLSSSSKVNHYGASTRICGRSVRPVYDPVNP